jgi:hypothetical protein
LVGQRKSPAESSGGLGTSSEVSSASLGMVAPQGNGKSGWSHLGIPGLKTCVLGPSLSMLLLPKLRLVEAGESSGGWEQVEMP